MEDDDDDFATETKQGQRQGHGQGQGLGVGVGEKRGVHMMMTGGRGSHYRGTRGDPPPLFLSHIYDPLLIHIDIFDTSVPVHVPVPYIWPSSTY